MKSSERYRVAGGGDYTGPGGAMGMTGFYSEHGGSPGRSLSRGGT